MSERTRVEIVKIAGSIAYCFAPHTTQRLLDAKRSRAIDATGLSNTLSWKPSYVLDHADLWEVAGWRAWLFRGFD